MPNSRRAFLADFSGWNVAFMLLYFLNAINITLDFGKPLLGAGVIALMGVQSGLVTWLVFSRKPITSLISTLVPIGCYYFYAFATGIPASSANWIPGIAIGLPLFHAGFSVVGSLFISLLEKWLQALNLPKGISGLENLSNATSKEDAKRKPIITIEIVCVVALTCVAYCTVYLVSWPNDAAVLANILVSLPVMAILLTILTITFLVIPSAQREIYNPALTHHLIEDADHTIGVRIGKVTVFFCTRCTAMLSGLFFSMYAFATFRFDIDPFLAFFLDIFVPAPVFIDWGLQRFGYRKAKTWSRVLTGALTGIGFSLVPQASPDYAIQAGIVLMSYFAVFFLIYFLSARRGYYSDDAEPEVDG